MPYLRLCLDPWLLKTGSWFVFVQNFRNAFTATAINYAVPVITARDYGWTQVENSLVFVFLSVESIISTAVQQWASRRVNDRNLLSAWGIIAHTGLLAYVASSSFGKASLPLGTFIFVLVWYDFGTSMPPTQSLYSKLIGKSNAGLYFSVLQSNSALATAISGQLVGFAYGSLGSPALWGLVQAMWIVSWIVLCFMWRRLHPEHIREMHIRLNQEQETSVALRAL